MVTGALQVPVALLPMAMTAPDRIPGTPSTTTACPLEVTASLFHPKQGLAVGIVFADPNPLGALPVAASNSHDMGLGFVICSQTTVAWLNPSKAMLGRPRMKKLP